MTRKFSTKKIYVMIVYIRSNTNFNFVVTVRVESLFLGAVNFLSQGTRRGDVSLFYQNIFAKGNVFLSKGGGGV